MKGFIIVTERQLADFLPRGKFSEKPTSEFRIAMKHCKLTNLLSENEFGDLDFSQFHRRHASLHFHSGIQMVKRNQTISRWLSRKPAPKQEQLLSLARAKNKDLRKKHADAEKAILVKTGKAG